MLHPLNTFGSFKYQYITVLIFLLSNINLFVFAFHFLTKISILSYVYWNQFHRTFFHIISKSDKKSAFKSIPPLQVLPGCVVVQVHALREAPSDCQVASTCSSSSPSSFSSYSSSFSGGLKHLHGSTSGLTHLRFSTINKSPGWCNCQYKV